MNHKLFKNLCSLLTPFILYRPVADWLALNLGCGPDYRVGYVNVDYRHDVKTDLDSDLCEFPWPWENDSVDDILMWHVLEHLPDTERTLREIHRVLKLGGRFYGQVPFCRSELSYAEPTHVKHFDWITFKAMERYGFRVVKSEPVAFNVTWRHTLRNLIPFRRSLSHLLWNMFDAVNFELVKKDEPI